MDHLPDEVNNLYRKMVKDFREELVPIKCSTCGTSTMVQKAYLSVIDKITSCQNCRYSK